jgi:drug/metabolite transporter (DMT)-like permease
LLGILFLFLGVFDVAFGDVYHFELWQVGVAFLGLLIGMLLAIASDPIWSWNYIRLVRRKEKETSQEGVSEPEFRHPPSIRGALLCVIDLFWVSWAIYPSPHWLVPITGTGFFGCG